MPRIEIPYIVRCDDDRKKHTIVDTIIEMNPADYYLNVMKEYVIDIVCVNNDIEAIKVRFLYILAHAVYWASMF